MLGFGGFVPGGGWWFQMAVSRMVKILGIAVAGLVLLSTTFGQGMTRFVNLGAIKLAYAGAEQCRFYGSVAGYSVQVVCFGMEGLEVNSVSVPGKRLIGGNDDDSIYWIIERDRSYRIGVGGIEHAGTF